MFCINHTININSQTYFQNVNCEKIKQINYLYSNLVKMLSDSKIYSHVFARCIVPLLLTPIVMGEQKAISFVIQKILKPKNKGNREFIVHSKQKD